MDFQYKFDFGIIDVLTILGIPFNDTGRKKLTIDCPFCGKQKHFSVDTVENIFHCYYCGTSGGMLHLYSMLKSVDRKQALQEIKDKLNIGGEYQPIKRVVHDDSNLYLPGSIEQRHQVYSALLNLLSLSESHRRSLQERGLNNVQIATEQYRSVPFMGHERIAYELLSQGLELKGIPGFFRTRGYRESYGTPIWTLRYSRSGILLPVRDLQGRIQGLQIRFDKAIAIKDPHKPDKTKLKRYGWLSTNENETRSFLDGAKAESWIHIAGSPQRIMILTEGKLKMDVIHALSMYSGIGVPGVNNLCFLGEWLDNLYRLGTREMLNAYDMDRLMKIEVQRALARANAIIRQHGMTVRNLRWDPAYKGYDDFLWAEKTARKIS